MAIEQAALRAVRRMVEIMEIERRAVIAGQGHAAGQIAVRRADHLVHHPVQGHDAQAEIVDQAQVGGKGDMIVGRVVVSGNVDRVVGENGNAHEKNQWKGDRIPCNIAFPLSRWRERAG
jgi:hypothetical protein